jgi:asparagine synthase (glutamine-hydrolysing)
MCDAQIHRGPDDEGYYASGPVSLGIRRLAIIDLTKGLYPLRNEKGTLHLVFNGEIYGYEPLRRQLEACGHTFHSNTDAETVIHSYEEWGTDSLGKLCGMFAFALWDEPKKLLWIARDHLGIKPLYYYQSKDFLAFASEIKPLLKHPHVSWRPNEKLIPRYLNTGLAGDGTEDTFFEGISQLAAAHHLLIHSSGVVTHQRYWTPDISTRVNGQVVSEEVEETRRLFLEGIRLHLVSDVPVGTCLSGGIDSSSVVCAVKKVYPSGAVSTGERIKTFSVVFPNDPIDETAYAKVVCDQTGAERNLVTPQAEELWNDLPALMRCQEEPFLGTTVYAQWRVMKLAKERGVTVLLDGQGGDELLSGYPHYYLHYLLTLLKHRKYSRILTEGVRSCDLTKPFVKTYLKAYVKYVAASMKSLLANRQGITADRSGLRAMMSETLAPTRPDDLATKLETDTTTTSLPALLRYEDKNSMWHSIEARVPFLHRPFFEYVASLPLDRKLRSGWTKYVFRLAMQDILPEEIRLRRSKIGFETPEKRWIEELRGKLGHFFSGPRLAATRYYDVDALRRLLAKRTLRNEEARLIWRILNLELWFSEFASSQSSPSATS